MSGRSQYDRRVSIGEYRVVLCARLRSRRKRRYTHRRGLPFPTWGRQDGTPTLHACVHQPRSPALSTENYDFEERPSSLDVFPSVDLQDLPPELADVSEEGTVPAFELSAESL